MGLRSWLNARKLQRQAWRILREAFADGGALVGTALKPYHAGRCVIQKFDVVENRIERIDFGIVRHPRPYAFSQQSHKVLEFYTYDVACAVMIRHRGENLTRSAGEDAG